MCWQELRESSPPGSVGPTLRIRQQRRAQTAWREKSRWLASPSVPPLRRKAPRLRSALSMARSIEVLAQGHDVKRANAPPSATALTWQQRPSDSGKRGNANAYSANRRRSQCVLRRRVAPCRVFQGEFMRHRLARQVRRQRPPALSIVPPASSIDITPGATVSCRRAGRRRTRGKSLSSLAARRGNAFSIAESSYRESRPLVPPLPLLPCRPRTPPFAMIPCNLQSQSPHARRQLSAPVNHGRERRFP